MKTDKKCLICDFVDTLYSIYDYQTYDDSDVTDEEYKEAKRQFLILFKKLVNITKDKDLKDEA